MVHEFQAFNHSHTWSFVIYKKYKEVIAIYIQNLFNMIEINILRFIIYKILFWGIK